MYVSDLRRKHLRRCSRHHAHHSNHANFVVDGLIIPSRPVQGESARVQHKQACDCTLVGFFDCALTVPSIPSDCALIVL